MKIGIIDAGGGLRGIYGSGVFDYCLDQNIHFDYCIGVSAGSANIASFLAEQKGRNRAFYLDYSFRKKYMSLSNFWHFGSYLDMDYIYGTLSVAGGENPLDYQTLAASPTEMEVVAFDAKTGKAKYFNKNDVRQNDYRIMMASSSIPVVCRPYRIGRSLYFDGALADPIPLKRAFANGCDKVVVLLTKPKNVLRSPKKDIRLAKILWHKFPIAATNLRLRAQKYNNGVALAKALEQENKALIIAPDNTEGVQTLTKDKNALERLYQKGYRDAQDIENFL